MVVYTGKGGICLIIYIAKQGDTWDIISFKVYGCEYHMVELIIENPDYVDVVVFNGGELLNIPSINNTDNPIKAPWILT